MDMCMCMHMYHTAFKVPAAFLAASRAAPSSPCASRCLLCVSAHVLLRAHTCDVRGRVGRGRHNRWRRAAHLCARSGLLLAPMEAALMPLLR